jgi:uncharacterized protein YndB with AHSA1/START domain
MPSAERTIEIAAPIETVFAFFTDPGNDRRWRLGVKEMHADGRPGVGAVVHQVVAGPGGRSIVADIEIAEYVVPTAYGFRTISGPVRPVGGYAFSPTADGTSVTFRLTAEVGGLKALFMGAAVQKSMDAEMAGLDRAKGLLEQH